MHISFFEERPILDDLDFKIEQLFKYKNANIDLSVQQNGKNKRYKIELDNNDLENLLNKPVTDVPIDRQLEMEFLQPQLPPFMDSSPLLLENDFIPPLNFQEPKLNTEMQMFRTPQSHQYYHNNRVGFGNPFQNSSLAKGIKSIVKMSKKNSSTSTSTKKRRRSRRRKSKSNRSTAIIF